MQPSHLDATLDAAKVAFKRLALSLRLVGVTELKSVLKEKG